jgi:vitamin K-dependent gamma-carboxylase
MTSRKPDQPIDAAGLSAFRFLWGAVCFVAVVRFLASGWIERFYGEPTFFFRHWGFGWLPVLPVPALYALGLGLAACALLVAVGLFYRAAAITFFLGFAYLQLLDVTRYLNHYWLVVWMALLFAVLPLGRAWSVDAWRRPALARTHHPAWVLWLLRFQVAVVYGFAGLAKLEPDWLLGGQPLGIWLSARHDTFLIGPLLAQPWAPLAFSWAGFLYDLTIVFWLSWRRTRVPAYLVVLAFHATTHLLFNIGMFPFLMTVAATIFFAPDWPRRLLGRPPVPSAPAFAATPRWPIALYVALHLAVPLRHFVYPGCVLWNEEGMRFAWKVMVREKHASVTYLATLPSGKVLTVSPRRYLTHEQDREFAAQPDLILQLAHHVGRDLGAVQVRADVVASLNGRPAVRLVDPDVDLLGQRDGLARKPWILPEKR